MPTALETGKVLPRPAQWSDEVVRAAAERLAPRVQEWAEEVSGALPGIIADLMEVLRSYHPLDGYMLAQMMEDRGYHADAELVIILDDADMAMRDAHRNAVAEWVKLYGIQTGYAVGDQVRFRYYRTTAGEKVTGTVYEIDEKHARLSVKCPSLGHVEAGKIGTQGVIIDFEDAERVMPEESPSHAQSEGVSHGTGDRSRDC